MPLALTTALIAVLLALSPQRILAGDEKVAVSFQDVEESLTCQCGCGLTVHSCNHLQCGSALPLRVEIREQMDQGMDKEAILAHFSEKYGEKILSSPTTTGFNVLAWIMPFAILGVSGIFVGLTLLRWRARGRAREVVDAKAPESGALSPYESTLERELKNFDG